MNKTEGNCYICLKISENVRKISETDENCKSTALKLQSCVPEIEWLSDALICKSCLSELNTAYKFREKCLENDKIRQNQENPEETPEITKSKPYECTLCKNRFRCSSNLLQHLKYHKGNRIFMCIYCGKSFITKSDVKIHEKLHLNKREYKCDQCPKNFNTHKDLRTHKLVVHTDPNQWQYICEICSKRFPIKSNYDAHMRRHRDERPFGCHLCEKKFIDKASLQKHLKSHSNVRAFVCEICQKEYKEKRAMDIHRAKIHGLGDVKIPVREKKFTCHICPKTYFEKNKLNAHLRRHTGERPHFCKVCKKSFTEKSYVTQHMKKVHNFVDNNQL